MALSGRICAGFRPQRKREALSLRAMAVGAMGRGRAAAALKHAQGWAVRGMAQFASGFSMPMPKRLDEIMPVALLQETEAGEIERLWNNYHIGRTHLSSTMSTSDYKLFTDRAQSCPMFVLPVARPKGFVTMLTQVQSPHVLVTGLEDYKVRGTGSSPFLTVTHYTELMDTKDLVLVRGDVVLPGKLADTEAAELLEHLHSFYVRDDRFNHVKEFNHNTRDFNFKEVVRILGLPAQW